MLDYKVSGKRLLFADKGIDFRNKVLSKINESNEKELVRIDLIDVQIGDVSFVREGFVKLITYLSDEPEHPQISFKNVQEYLKQNMDDSFTNRKKFAFIVDLNGKWDLIGKYSQQMIDTLKVLIRLEEAKARQIAEELGGIELTTCNNRLISLYNMCVISRKEIGQKSGGLEYLYRVTA